MTHDYSQKVRRLRLDMGLTQHTLAERLNVRPQVVASWEQGRKEPSASSYQQLAKLAPPDEAWFFLEKIGVTKELIQSKWLERARGSAAKQAGLRAPGKRKGGSLSVSPATEVSEETATEGHREQLMRRMVQIPILRDEAAGRTPKQVTAGDIESYIAMPAQSAPKDAALLTAIHVRGDAMKPTLCDRFVAVIDHVHREAANLAGRIVAVRLGDAVVIRRLAQATASSLVLSADNTEYAELSIAASRINPIIGDIIFWWGTQG